MFLAIAVFFGVVVAVLVTLLLWVQRQCDAITALMQECESHRADAADTSPKKDTTNTDIYFYHSPR